MIKTQYNRSQSGFSLVELIIAMALSGFLMAGVITIFADSRKTDAVTESLSRLQETGRFALDLLGKDIRMAGYQGCADPEQMEVNIIAKNPPTTSMLTTAVRGWEVTAGTWADGTEFDNTDIENNARIGSDVIAIQRGVGGDTQLVGNLVPNNANIRVNNNDMQFEKGDIVLISDCESADMFRISSNPDSNTWTHAADANTETKLSQLYDDRAKIMSFVSLVYFVGDTGRNTERGEDIYALYRARDNLDNTGASTFEIEELLEGVESLQILYGELLATNNIVYTTADRVTDMQQVRSVRLGVLASGVKSPREQRDNSTYALPGQLIVADAAPADATEHAIDNRLRRDFMSTFSIRNRL